jgi:putative hemolysin
VRGDTPIRDVNRELDLNLPEGDGWSTIGGLGMAVAGRVPRPGEVLNLDDGTTLYVEAASERSVERVRLVPPAEPRKE